MDARRAIAIALSVIAVALRILGALMSALTVILCFSGLSARLNIVGLVIDISRLIPDLIAGYGVITSPFGGVFRLDFALVALIFFLLDYLCV
ncbi:MAG: hypothetical protein SOU51_05350, partial [Collinsella sp.]|nr:hypothetical protein [Collinsella sp.]